MTPIERAARALAGWTPNVKNWADVCADPKDEKAVHAYYLNQVRVVLTAIREPSHEMQQSGFSEGGCDYSYGCWQAMIDAALAEIPSE